MSGEGGYELLAQELENLSVTVAGLADNVALLVGQLQQAVAFLQRQNEQREMMVQRLALRVAKLESGKKRSSTDELLRTKQELEQLRQERGVAGLERYEQKLLDSTRPLAYLLTEAFSLDELATLAFDLGVDIDTLIVGGTIQQRARELVLYFSRRNELGRLIERLKQERPKKDWAV